MDSTNYTTIGVLGTTITGSGFSADCKLGTLLAIDADGTYIPAIAAWSGSVGRNGCSIPALSSYVIGVLVSDVAAGSGLILCDGVITDPDIVSAMIPASVEDDTGAYYLSTQTAGLAKRGPDSESDIVTYCFSHRRENNSPTPTDKTSGNMTRTIIFRPTAPEYAGHSHHCVEFSSEWQHFMIDTDANAYGSVTKISTASEAGKLLELSASSVELLQNGTQLPRDRWDYRLHKDDTYEITLNRVTVIADDKFMLCGTTPFTAREPIVRGLRYGKTSEGLFKFSGLYGQLEMSINTNTVTPDQFTGTAVLSLTDDGMKTGPVVQEVVAGPGISVASKTPGRLVISNESISQTYLDMQVCNLDGVILGSGDIFTSFVFPKDVTSRLYGTLRVPHFGDSTMTGKIRLLVRGGNANSSLQLQYRLLTPPKIDAKDGVSIPTAATEASLDLSKAGTKTNLAYLITSEPLSLEADSLLLCQVLANKPSSSVEVFSVSLVLGDD